jgi:hypothetical protein
MKNLFNGIGTSFENDIQFVFQNNIENKETEATTVDPTEKVDENLLTQKNEIRGKMDDESWLEGTDIQDNGLMKMAEKDPSGFLLKIGELFKTKKASAFEEAVIVAAKKNPHLATQVFIYEPDVELPFAGKILTMLAETNVEAFLESLDIDVAHTRTIDDVVYPALIVAANKDPHATLKNSKRYWHHSKFQEIRDITLRNIQDERDAASVKHQESINKANQEAKEKEEKTGQVEARNRLKYGNNATLKELMDNPSKALNTCRNWQDQPEAEEILKNIKDNVSTRFTLAAFPLWKDTSIAEPLLKNLLEKHNNSADEILALYPHGHGYDYSIRIRNKLKMMNEK